VYLPLITARITEQGKLAARGDVSVQDRTLKLQRPLDSIEDVSIDFTTWLNGAAYTSYDIDAGGLTITGDSVTSNVLSFKAEHSGRAQISILASTGKQWSGWLDMSEEWGRARIYDYGWC
jgi:hypothetical protein